MKEEMDTAREEVNAVDLENYRRLVRTYIDMRRYKTALYWAEKVCCLSEHDAKDVYWQAQCMFMMREYHRAAHIIKSRGLEKTNIFCLYLLVESLYEATEYQEALDILNLVDLEYLTGSAMHGSGENAANDTVLKIMCTVDLDANGPTRAEVLASICFMKGKTLEALDNRTLAMDAYVEALHLSVYCTEALDALVQHDMLYDAEEQELISHLPVDSQCSESEAKVLLRLYKSKLKKYYESWNADSSNITETPISGTNIMKTITELSERNKKGRADAEPMRPARDSSKLFTPIHQNILTTTQKYLNDAKSPSVFSMQVSLSKFATPLKHQSFHVTPVQPAKKQSNERRKRSSIASNIANSNYVPLQTANTRLEESVALITAKAETLFYNNEYKKCSQILEEVLKVDPYYCPALIILVGCLMELKENNKLFCLAHKLVDLYSDEAISWYAVGCYYDLIGKSDPARRYLSKATTIDRQFGPAWLAYGHSFAKENEHDQAMAAYFKATQLMRGCHLPLLYIGVECGLTKNLDLAERFFHQALSNAPLDVNVMHELGVVKFEYEMYEDAEDIFRETLKIVTAQAEENKEAISARWEPLMNNLGHCCRKNKKYDESLKFHERALVLKPLTAPTYTAIGFVHALRGSLDQAVDHLHRSLALKRDDVVATALLKLCLEDLINGDDETSDYGKKMDQSTDDDDTDRNWRPDPSAPSTASEGTKLRGIKITFDEDSNSSDMDMNMSLD